MWLHSKEVLIVRWDGSISVGLVTWYRTQKPPSHRPANTDEAGDVEKSHVMRGRSASTGSITTPGERHSATPPDEDFSLLIAQKGPPPTKPRPPKKVRVMLIHAGLYKGISERPVL